MKIFILYRAIEQPFGGANQFIRALKIFCAEQGVLVRNILDADLILLNGHSLGGNFGTTFSVGYWLKALFPQKIFVHRIDGPVQLYGDATRAHIDQGTYALNEAVADGSIFQSGWSRTQNQALGMRSTPYQAIIYNAPDARFFFPPARHVTAARIRLVATSWSHHPNKGFDIYHELDERLDWSRFSMTFIGRCSIPFRNIVVHDPVSSDKLGQLLRRHDIYITASQNDPCSNALLEALACGLPAVARASGGHPELVQRAGVLFNDTTGALEALAQVAQNLDHYRRLISVKPLADCAVAYLEFCKRIIDDRDQGRYTPKRIPIRLAASRLFATQH